MHEPSLKELLDVATEAAYLGGKRAMAYYNTGVAVEIKADASPVTRADREAEAVIREIVGRLYPDHAILGEEMGHTPGTQPYRWIVDPIDGTKSFIHGVPLWGVLIGVEVRGVASVGVCYHPVTDEMLSAAVGHGASLNGRPARVSKVDRLADATLCCTAPHRARRRSGAYDKLQPAVGLARGWGDCYAYTLVATGRAEIALDPAMNPWDCAPFLPILTEAGGRFTTWAGEPTIYGKDAFATNGLLHEQVRALLQ